MHQDSDKHVQMYSVIPKHCAGRVGVDKWLDVYRDFKDFQTLGDSRVREFHVVSFHRHSSAVSSFHTPSDRRGESECVKWRDGDCALVFFFWSARSQRGWDTLRSAAVRGIFSQAIEVFSNPQCIEEEPFSYTSWHFRTRRSKIDHFERFLASFSHIVHLTLDGFSNRSVFEKITDLLISSAIYSMELRVAEFDEEKQ